MAYVDIESLRRIIDPNERYQVATEEFKKIRRIVSEEILREMDEKGIKLVTLAEAVHVDAGGLSRRLKGEFTLPPDRLVKMCTSVFSRSCHEMMFGEPAITIVPRFLASALKAIEKASSQIKKNILLNIVEIYDKERNDGTLPLNISGGQLIRQRIEEVAEDKHVLPMEILGSDASASIKVCLKKYTVDQSDYVGNMTTLMYYAFELGTTLDYFIVQDYSIFTEIGYRDAEGIVRKIIDPTALQFTSKFLRLSEEGKREAISNAWACLWKGDSRS